MYALKVSFLILKLLVYFDFIYREIFLKLIKFYKRFLINWVIKLLKILLWDLTLGSRSSEITMLLFDFIVCFFVFFFVFLLDFNFFFVFRKLIMIGDMECVDGVVTELYPMLTSTQQEILLIILQQNESMENKLL